MTVTSAEPRGSAELEVVNPATGTRIGTAPMLDATEVAALAERGRAAQPAWQALGFDGRAVVFRRMQQWMADHAGELLEVVQAETGRVFEDSVLKAVQLLYGTVGKIVNLGPRARLAARKIGRID